MSDIENKRQFVMGLYPGPAWQRRVKRMPDNQVLAIYLREHGKPPKKEETPKETGDDPAPF